MSIFNRIAGTEQPKVAVWPIMMDITRVMDEEISFTDLAEQYSLSAEEQAEMAEYIQAIGAMIVTEVTERMTFGWGQVGATRDARVSIDAVLRYALLRIEQGTMTLEQFRTALGLPND